MRLRRKTYQGIPKFASGGSAGGEILDFQRQYNPFLGDYPTYGMVGSGQPGAWMFFDDAWLRSQPQQPATPMGPEPVSNVVEAPDFNIGPDGGGADRYQDDWRGYGYGPSITPADYGIEPDYSNLESFAGYNAPAERAVEAGPEMQTGQPMSSEPPAGWGYGGEDDVFAANMAAEALAAQAAQSGAPAASSPGYSRAGTGTQEIGGRVWGGNREPLSPTSPANMDDLFGAPVIDQGWPAMPDLPELPSEQDYQPASNTGYSPAGAYVDPGPVQFAEPLEYVAAPDYQQPTAGPGIVMGGPSLGLSLDFNKGTVSVDPSTIGGFFGNIGSQLGPSDRLAISEYLSDKTAGMGFGGGAPNFGEAGKVGAAALDALLGATPPGEKFGEKATESFQTGQQGSGTAKQAAAALGAPTGAPIGLGGLFGGVASPGTPAGGAAAALADLYGLMPNDEYGFMAGALAQPQEPTNTVPGVATPGAPVGISAPAMDPLAGLTDQQIEALAAGYHDQAPAVGVASPVAGFETALAAAQAAAERASEGKGSAKGGTGSTGGIAPGGRENLGGWDKGSTPGQEGSNSGGTGGDNSGSGPTGNDTFGGTDSSGNNSDGGSGTDGGMGDDSGASGTSGGSGDEGGMGAWKAGGRVKSRGLPSMADQVAQAGRGNDTVLAHITPNEAARLDAAMGGPSINPETGLREYGFFDDIGDFLGDAAKAVAPIAGGVLGGMFGGPLGAAAGAALGTTLVGGNLQEALLSGGVAGIGAYAAPKMAGGVEGLFGGGDEAATLGGGGTDAGMGQGSGGGFLSGIMGNPLAMVGLGAAGGLGAGYMMGDSDTPSASPTQAPAPWVPRQGGLAQRNYRPYEGNYSTYGQVGGGGGHQFYDQVNPGVVYYAEGGSVEAPSKKKMRETLGRELLSGNDMTSPVSVLQIAQMAMPPRPAQQLGLPAPQMQEPGQLQQPMPPTGQGMMGQWQQQAMPPWLIDRDDEGDGRIANLLWKNSGGEVTGPGGGQDDLIPAMLSNGEYVLTATDVGHLGDGSTDRGADKLDQMVQNIRRHKASNGQGLPPQAKSPLEYMGR